MLGEISGISKFVLRTGYTDLRLGIDGLSSLIENDMKMDPLSNALFLFCGRKCDRIKALHHDKTGFVLYYMRLDLDRGRFIWPRNTQEARQLTRQELRWLFEGLSIDQKTAFVTKDTKK